MRGVQRAAGGQISALRRGPLCIRDGDGAERTKHFDIKYHWLREKIKANKVELRYVNTHEQLADIFTKPLGVMQHNYLKGRLTGFR